MIGTENNKRPVKISVLIFLLLKDLKQIQMCQFCHMSHRISKTTICRCENKGADQLRGNREADQCLCFRYTDRTIP